MIEVYHFRAWSGRLVVDITSGKANAARTIRLHEEEARQLVKDLTAALAAGPTPCHDCGSDLHQAGSPGCRYEEQERDEE